MGQSKKNKVLIILPCGFYCTEEKLWFGKPENQRLEYRNESIELDTGSNHLMKVNIMWDFRPEVFSDISLAVSSSMLFSKNPWGENILGSDSINGPIVIHLMDDDKDCYFHQHNVERILYRFGPWSPSMFARRVSEPLNVIWNLSPLLCIGGFLVGIGFLIGTKS